MTNEERKVLELALDWIQKQPEETPHSKYDVDTRYVVLRELEAALAQPKQKNCEYNNGTCTRNGCRGVCQAEICRKKVETQLAQSEQEPVAFEEWLSKQHGDPEEIGFLQALRIAYISGQDSITTPPKRKPLTDEQMWELWNSQGDDAMEQTAAIAFARDIEAAHNIKE